MDETRVRGGQHARVGRVEGDLWAENHAVIQPSEGSLVSVGGRALFDGSVEVEGDLECAALKSRDGLVRINGGLTVHGDVDVEEALYAVGKVKAEKVDIGGRLSAGDSLEADSVDVGGSLEVQGGMSADSVDVGGTLDVAGEVKLRDLEAGGKADVGGGEVTGKIEVGGKFESRRPLKFDQMETGGTVDLVGGEGRRIEVGGRLRSRGDLKCDDLEVGGLAEVDGTFSGVDVEVGGMLRVTGDLQLTGLLEVGGVAEVGGILTGRDVDVGGQLKASKGLLSGRVRVGSMVVSPQGFKAELIELGRGGKCVGTLVGGRVILGDRAQVQDVYCSQLEAGDKSRMGKVFAESAQFGDGCVVEGLVYTKDYRQGDRVVFLSQPQKTGGLPPFPL